MIYTKEQLDVYSKALTELKSLETQLNDRFGEIIGIIYKVFGNKLRDWWHSDADTISGDIGTICPFAMEELIRDNNTDYDIDYESDGTIYNAANTNRYSFSWHFPVKWLLWTDEQIEKFIRDEIEKDAKEIQEYEAERSDRDKIIEQALKKLTEEERKALGLGI